MERIALILEDLYLAIKVELIDRVLRPNYYKSDEIDQRYPTFKNLLNNVDSTFTKEDGNFTEFELSVKYSNEPIRITKASLLNKSYGKNKPNLIFHHGAGEIGKISTVSILVNRKIKQKFNVFFIRAAHHKSRKDYLRNCQSSFLKWMLTFIGSTLIVEELLKVVPGKTIVSGISMGGIVSTLHFLEFNSVQYYVPLLGYNDVPKIFLESYAFSNSIDKRDERVRNASLMNSFSYKNRLSEKNKDKVIPILGKFDKFIDYDAASKFWEGYQVRVFDVGHSSILVKRKQIRKLYLQLAKELNERK
ncbi:hypothetical protein GF389_01440 [Candidatus Dojkabacteria bacterium]|nr:hypothetical protein [Candidatus Dojkabacteria bacterium]